jgi:polar amino acid transport system permease protein
VADWGQIQSVFFRGDMIKETFAQGLPTAFKNTIVYTLGAFVLGLIWGTILALMRLSSVAPYRWLASTYIEFFRGLPAIVVFIAFGLLPLAFPGLVIPFDPYGTVWIALGLVGSGIHGRNHSRRHQAVPKGAGGAARSLGMPSGVATRKIVLPQAFRIITPPLTNELILLVRTPHSSTSSACQDGIRVDEVCGRDIANTNANLTPLVIAGFCYLLITLPLSMVVRRMEARQKKER